MKKLYFILILVVGLFGLTHCEDKNKEEFGKLTFEDLPLSSREFLTQYFPDNPIVSITLDKAKDRDALRSSGNGTTTVTELMLYVALKEDVIVTFSPRDGSWRYIEARNGLPGSATELLHHYPKLELKEPRAKVIDLLRLNGYTIVITLDNGRKYAETEGFTFSGSVLAEVGISDEKVAAKLTEFGKRNQLDSVIANGLWFKLAEEKGVVYRFFIGDLLILTFDEKGDWIHGEIPFFIHHNNTKELESLFTKIAENELPENVGEAVRGVWDKGAIEIISCYSNGYYGFKFEKVDLLVTEKNGIMPPPVEMTNKLIADYFEIPYKLVVNPVYRVSVGAYEYNYTYYYQSGADYVHVRRDIYNNIIEIGAFFIEKDKMVSVNLPPKMLEEILPAQITDYMHVNYKDQKIYRMIFTKGYGYSLYIDNYYLSFTEEGRFRERREWRII